MNGKDFSFSLENFDGRVRLFPLPNLVVFPHVMQPLRVFEPRYRDLLADALANDKLIAMSLLQPGWEPNYEGRPAIHPVVCVCRIATQQQFDSGESNILLIGVNRARIVNELPHDKSYRQAKVELLHDFYPTDTGAQRALQQYQLLTEFKKILPKIPDAQEQLDQLLGNEIPLGVLTDIVSYTLDLNIHVKQQLLAEPNVDVRTQLLLDHFASPGDSSSRPFPPQFSAN